MKSRFSRIGPRSRIAAAIAVLTVVGAVAIPSLASGSGAQVSSEFVKTIYIRGNTPKSLRFVGPKTIAEGQVLQIVNETNPKKVGPQTFTLVEASEVPKTKKEREACLKKGHICRAIVGWHMIKGNSAKVAVVKAGQEGWDTEGSLSSKGDSWFTGTKAHATFEQQVAAGATAAPITLAFMSALDPSLHGTITVKPLG